MIKWLFSIFRRKKRPRLSVKEQIDNLIKYGPIDKDGYPIE